MECRLVSLHEVGGSGDQAPSATVVFGEIVRWHVHEEVGGRFEMSLTDSDHFMLEMLS